MNDQSVAILYFSRHASSDAQQKAWFGNLSQKNKKLSTALIQQSWNAIQEANLPIFHFHEGNQEGNTFGERLSNAFSVLYEKGFEAVIAVGNDCPEISQLDWNQIRTDLKSANNVLGKSIRGGAYLLGITSENFQKEAFENLPWQSNQLFDSLLDQLKTTSSDVIELQVLRDINTFFDIKKFRISAVLNSTFKSLIDSLIEIKRTFYFQISQPTFLLFRDTPLRAPPSII
jgi:hypothetical protein